LEGITEYEGEDLVFNTKHFYNWAKENDFDFTDEVEEMLKRYMAEVEEAFLLWEFKQRYKKNCKRKIGDDKLALALLEPLWVLREGLILLDGFEPTGDSDLDKKCLELDEKMSRLYKCAIDASKINKLELIKEKAFLSLTYKVRPADLVEWLSGMGHELQLLSKAKEKIADSLQKETPKYKRGQAVDINPKEKSSFLKIIYALVDKHYKYDPSQEKNSDISKVLNLIQHAGLKMNRKTLKKAIDEAYEHANSEIED